MSNIRILVFLMIILSTLGQAVLAQTAQEFYNKARNKAEMQNYRGALNDLNEAIKQDPKFIQAFNYRGYVKDELDDYHGALSDYNMAIALKGDYSEAYANRGRAKHKMRDFKGAMEDYTTAITLNPLEKDALIGRGTTLSQMSQYEAALKDLDNAVQIDPRYGKTYSIRGQVRLLKGDILGACSDLIQAQKLGFTPPMAAMRDNCK